MQRLRLALPRPARGLAILLCFALITPLFNSIALAQPSAPVDDVIDSLAQAGIAVYEDFEGRNPIRPLQGSPSALKLTRWQVENLAREVDDGGGFLGEQYDAIARLPHKSPPFSYFIAAWIAGGHSPAARYAQRIMGKQIGGALRPSSFRF